MTLLDTDRPTVRPVPAPRAVLVDDGPGLTLVPRRHRDDLLAWLRAGSLDRQLAGGTAAETSRLLATRAAQLTARHHRDVLADRWDELVDRAHRPTHPSDPHVPVARQAVCAALEHVATLTDRLRSDRPVSAAGVAAAGLLLTRGGSPVYDRRSTNTDLLAAAVRSVVSSL